MSSNKSDDKKKVLFDGCKPGDKKEDCCSDHTVLPDGGPPDPQRYCNKPHGSTFQEGIGRCGKYWLKVNNTCTAADYVPIFGVPSLARIASFDMEYMIGEQVETLITYPANAELINTDTEMFVLKPETGEICVKCAGFYHFMSSVATFGLDDLDWRMHVGGFLNQTNQFGRRWTSGTGHPGIGNAPIFTVPSLFLNEGDCVAAMTWTDKPGGDLIELAYVSLERIY